MREAYPWLGDDDLSFSEPSEIGPDMDAVIVRRGDAPMARVVMLRRLNPTHDEPENPTVFAVAVPDGWGPQT